MKNINVILQDPLLEKTIMRLVEQRQQNLQDFVIAALQNYVKEIEQPLNIPKLDPFQHSQQPTAPFQTIFDDKIFEDVENTAKFAKKLR
jgi:hypothetical protein